ncbi:MAG TPA: aminoglycoside adenylyltransferase domain-containing protein, partial [Candidatus Binataceae bacterium]|nr:aminoglycoside adenylyltransferase domain-containing protein [Candidatus Binataceae bacterium]
MPYQWDNCPPEIRRQVENLVAELRTMLKDDLAGVYLHGSLALGCFNPRRSDIDLLIVSEKAVKLAIRKKLAWLFLTRSRKPIGLEATVVSRTQLRQWRHPSHFEFHFSEDWRGRYRRELDAQLRFVRVRDPDLAMQIATARARGRRLFGGSRGKVLPQIPFAHQVASAMQDLRWARARIRQDPAYFVLNACRICALVESRRILSKDEGAAWALQRFPAEHRRVVRWAS